MDFKKEAKKEYLRKGTEAGIYLIKLSGSSKAFIGYSVNVQGSINRSQFELKMKMHKNNDLQNDFIKLGAEKFSFEVIDKLTKKENSNVDIKKELIELEVLWREKLVNEGMKFYN